MLNKIFKRNKFITNHKKYLNRINDCIFAVLKDSKVYLFGSVIEGNLVAASDIDILIIADVPKKHLERAGIIAEIEEKAGLPLSHPFEFHLITEKELKSWNKIYNLKYQKISLFL